MQGWDSTPRMTRYYIVGGCLQGRNTTLDLGIKTAYLVL